MPAHRIEEAVLVAIEFFDRMYQEKRLIDVMLEEVREKNEKEWEVTMGFSRIVQDSSPIRTLTEGPKYERAYKTLTVDKDSGKVEAMTIRDV